MVAINIAGATDSDASSGAESRARLTPHDLRRVAVTAGVDPRTVVAYLDPAKRARMHSTTRGRIGDTLSALGLDPPRAA